MAALDASKVHFYALKEILCPGRISWKLYWASYETEQLLNIYYFMCNEYVYSSIYSLFLYEWLVANLLLRIVQSARGPLWFHNG